MKLNDPKVRQRVLEHIAFAVSAVEASFASEELSSLDPETKTMITALRNPLTMQILSYTLNLDAELRNSITSPFQELL